MRLDRHHGEHRLSGVPALVERARGLRYCGIGKSGFEASADKTRWWEYNITDDAVDQARDLATRTAQQMDAGEYGLDASRIVTGSGCPSRLMSSGL